jgi:transcriptional regulator with XRE-family HTH domain
MTPFGEEMRRLRTFRGITMQKMATDLGVTPAYLSALEHGHRGRPNRRFLHRVCQYFAIIWDEAEELEKLAHLSTPKAVLDSAGLSAKHARVANELAVVFRDLDEMELEELSLVVERRKNPR